MSAEAKVQYAYHEEESFNLRTLSKSQMHEAFTKAAVIADRLGEYDIWDAMVENLGVPESITQDDEIRFLVCTD